MVRITLPYHLTNLAKCSAEVSLDVESPVTVNSILDALEAQYPNLRGTVRDHETLKRRPFLRFFACGEDITMDSFDSSLPEAIANAQEPFMIVGAIAGG